MIRDLHVARHKEVMAPGIPSRNISRVHVREGTNLPPYMCITQFFRREAASLARLISGWYRPRSGPGGH